VVFVEGATSRCVKAGNTKGQTDFAAWPLRSAPVLLGVSGGHVVSRGDGCLLVVSASAQAEKSHANGEHSDCFDHNWFVSPPSGAGCDMWFRGMGE